MHLVECHNVDIVRAQMTQRGAQEFGCDLKVMVGFERGRATRPDVV
jgi:hypothetical protein